MYKLLLIAAAGAVGTLARYGMSGMFARSPERFPWAILLVNLLGCFLIGYLQALFGRTAALSPEQRVAVLVGLLGGFTTFSTFGWDTAVLLREGRAGLALLNAALSTVGGVAMVLVGARLAGGTSS